MRPDPFLAFLAFLAVRVLLMRGDDALTITRRRLTELREGAVRGEVRCEKSVESEKTPADHTPHASALLADPCRAWRLRNAERLTNQHRQRGLDAGGFCAEHGRWLSYPERKRGACSWCLPVDPEWEPEYWASHWRRYNGRP